MDRQEAKELCRNLIVEAVAAQTENALAYGVSAAVVQDFLAEGFKLGQGRINAKLQEAQDYEKRQLYLGGI